MIFILIRSFGSPDSTQYKAKIWSCATMVSFLISLQEWMHADALLWWYFFIKYNHIICIIKLRKINGLAFLRSNYSLEPLFTIPILPRSVMKWEIPLPKMSHYKYHCELMSSQTGWWCICRLAASRQSIGNVGHVTEVSDSPVLSLMPF